LASSKSERVKRYLPLNHIDTAIQASITCKVMAVTFMSCQAETEAILASAAQAISRENLQGRVRFVTTQRLISPSF
jgi:hypothetical protein